MGWQVLLVSKKTAKQNYCQYEAKENYSEIQNLCAFILISLYLKPFLLSIDSDRFAVFHNNAAII